MDSPTSRRIALCVCLAVALARPGRGQTSGNTVPVVHLPVFQTSNQSLFGPGTTPAAIDRTFTLVSESWSESGQAGDVRGIEGFDFGGRIAASTSGGIGFHLRLESNAPGSVNVTYPVKVELLIPEPNSFRGGDEIAIRSQYALEPGWHLGTQAAAATVTLGSSFAFHAQAGAEVCLFQCAGAQFFPPVDLPQTTFDVIGVSSTGGVSIPLPGWTVRPVPAEVDFFGIRGTADAPRVVPVAHVELDGRTLVAEGAHAFMTLSFSFAQFLNARFPFLPPLGLQTPNILGVQGGYHLLDINTPVQLAESQRFAFSPDLHVELRLPLSLAWRVTTPGGTPVSAGTGDVVRLAVGNTLHLAIPEGRTEPLPTAPRYDLPNLFSSRTSLNLGAGVTVGGGRFLLRVPSVVVADPCDIVGEDCPIRSPAINVDVGPLINESANSSQSANLFPFGCDPSTPGCGNWQLQGFAPVAAELFQLDPEAPRIEVATSLASAVATGTGAPGTFTQTIVVSNAGDVRLDAVQATDLVLGGTAGLRVLSSPTLTVNPGFDGTGDISTLTGADAIGVSESGTVLANFAYQPGTIYQFTVIGSGTSPIGTPVADTATARLAVFPFDVRPDPLNTGSQGVLPTTIEGTASLGVTSIDPASLRLAGVAPLRWNYAHRGGERDLNLKFDRQELIGAIAAQLAPGPVPALPDVTAVAHAVLGNAAALSEDDRVAADQRGNANGRLDIGDLRALALGTHVAPAPTSATTADPPNGVPGGQPVTLVLTGVLTDGTAFFAEDRVVLLQDGRIQ